MTSEINIRRITCSVSSTDPSKGNVEERIARSLSHTLGQVRFGQEINEQIRNSMTLQIAKQIQTELEGKV